MNSAGTNRSREIYTYRAPWPVYGVHWCQRPGTFRLGFGSFIEEYANKIQIVELFDWSSDFVRVAETDHHYPITKLLWSPFKGNNSPDLFATTGDYLRIHELSSPDSVEPVGSKRVGKDTLMSQQIQCRATLANVRRMGPNKRDLCAPLTSFDWNETDPSMIVTSSIDTTCTVWDINTQQAKTQLIAHDKEVYDVAFARGTDIFASVGADGSVRLFDLRALEHSTIIYETQGVVVQSQPSGSGSGTTGGSGGMGGAPGGNMMVESPPLLRLAWNKQDPNYIATFQSESSSVIILDIRVPAVPVTELHGHGASVNSINWAPHSSGHICTAADDCHALVWDISQIAKQRMVQDPILSFKAEAEINQLAWSPNLYEWIAISCGNTLQALKV
ncbi:ddb1 and cul4 associated factor 7 [Chytridiales sp. JEL 0842]|nr:ddb1 and cul4 associated factor 7 [Chytridiales sp. JEL 0842]